VQGPDQYLNALGVELACIVFPERKAIIDSTHRALVNYETYYLSNREAMTAFTAAPYRYTGRLTDPVTRERFVPSAESPRREGGGRVFYFASAETVAQFDSDPDRFSALDLSM
jgi:YHS domain-containing protein